MNKPFRIMVIVSTLGVAPHAFASEPAQLTNAQMDRISAGAAAMGAGAGTAIGTLFSGIVVTITTQTAGADVFVAGEINSVAASFLPGPQGGAASSLGIGLTSP
jgi:hypothetical protein